ncbi:MAG TPA: protein phosphatase 2C domain-containing protein [Candidatus Dormibacteraeota bacterium]|jgi:hypothetical protein|nr:protein phosphatase 2C domain-containing protein [Candidatus Dormibacteraeota bacterium]
MRFFSDVLWVQKAGNPQEEYEDAFWPRRVVLGERHAELSVAVADGATESSFSGVWARQLVHAYCRGILNSDNVRDSLLKKQQAWARFAKRKPLPWYAEEKVREGAFSTILGFSMRDGVGTRAAGLWEAFAVGDSCLVQIRDEMLLTRFPLSTSADFTNNPFLLGSNPEANVGIDSQTRIEGGNWQSGDNFYLMTDALAAWFFRAAENDQTPWRVFRDLNTDELPFRPWVDQLRKKNEMRNDDVTLYRIEID